jgi:hypothetical protein
MKNLKPSHYNVADINLDGKVNYIGTGSDSRFIYQNVLMNNTANKFNDSFSVIREQLPK